MSVEPIFVGLDLAWSSRHNTAGAVARWDAATGRARLTAWREELGSNDEIVEWVRSVAPRPGPAFVAIDAPLVVPNVSGARQGDRLISRTFRAYQAGTHPANRTNLGRYGQPPGDIRGETLTARFVTEAGFEHDPYVEPEATRRQIYECYPHPAMVVLFNLTTTLKYKRKLKSLGNDRYEAYETLQGHLANLARADPGLDVPPEVLSRDTRKLRGKALKHYEDLLDALMCAYIALYYWRWGQERVHVFGDLATGYIVAPVTPELKAAALVPFEV